MIIKSLNEMETIVENNEVLSWNGWTVIESDSNTDGFINKLGAFVNGNWIVQKRYEPGANGWDIPKLLVVKNGSQG